MLTLEMVWMREVSLRAGNTVVAAAMVFAAFFTAAALGNWLGAAASRRCKIPLLVYGGFELLAGSAAVVTFVAGQWLWRHWDAGLSAFSGPVLITLLFVGVPSFFSGAAFPNLMRMFVADRERRASHGGLFYGANLLGASAGVAVGGVLFPWWLGLRGTFTAAAVLQITGGALAVWIALRMNRDPVGKNARGEAPVSRSAAADWGWGLPFLSGALSLAAQALLIMWARQILEGSIYAVSSVLAAFIGGLGLGSLAAGMLRRRRYRATMALAGFAALAALLLFVVPLAGRHLIAQGVEWTGATPPVILGQSLFWSSLWLLPLTVCLGGVFPLTWELACRKSGDEGAVAGIALAVNKMGSALGMVAGNFLLLPALGLSRGTCAIGWGYLLLCLLMLFRDRRWPTLAVWTALLPLAGFGAWQTLRHPDALGLRPNETPLAVYPGSYGEVSVLNNLETGSHQILLNSQQRLSGTKRALSSQRHQAWVPLLFCRDPERVVTIGMASGISAAAMLDFPVKELYALELVPEVVRAAREHFAPWNSRLFADPRTRILTGDGRAVLQHLPGKFDAIICDLFFPNEDGTANLYSREFFENALSRLNPDGVFCLWLPCYQHDPETAGIVIRTFMDVFPNAVAVRSNLDPMQPVLGLLGSARPLPASRKFLEAQLNSPAGRTIATQSPFFRSPENAWLLLAGDLHAAEPGFAKYPATTDDRPLFLFLGPRASSDRHHLVGMVFLNWIGRQFPRPLFPSLELAATPPSEILGAIRAANYYFAAAIASSVIPGDTRPEELRQQQTAGYLRNAGGLCPNARLPVEALNQ